MEVLQAGDALAKMQQALLQLEEELNEEREHRLALQQDLEDYKAAWEEEPVYENEHSPLATRAEVPRGMQVQNQSAPSAVSFQVPAMPQANSPRPLYERDPLYERSSAAPVSAGLSQLANPFVPSVPNMQAQGSQTAGAFSLPIPAVPANLSAGVGGQTGTSTQGPVFHVTMKPREPPVFSGKSHEDIENWIYTVSAYFRTVAAPEAQKVGYALTFLQDAAREWWISTIRSTGREPGTWQELADALRARFGHRTKEMTARAELRVIKQQKGESVRVYAAQFNRLLGHLLGYNKAWARTNFLLVQCLEWLNYCCSNRQGHYRILWWRLSGWK